MYVCMYLWYECMYTYIHIHICVSVCVCLCAYLCLYTQNKFLDVVKLIHTHKHMCSHSEHARTYTTFFFLFRF